MPDHFYTGPAGLYPVLRDTAGLLVSDVEPGDVHPFDEAPDPYWLPVEGNEDHAALAAAREAASADAGEKRGEEEGESPALAAMRRARRDGNAPPPVPGTTAPADATTPAGPSGSEES